MTKAKIGQLVITFVLASAGLSGCKVSSIPDITNIEERVPVTQSKSVSLLVYNDYSDTVILIEESVPEWISIGGLVDGKIAPKRAARVNLTARCGEQPQIRQASVFLQSANGMVSKSFNVRIECYGVGASPEPAPQPPEEEIPEDKPAPKKDFSLRGTESFSPESLDNTVKDKNGLTLKGWYDLLVSGGTSGEMDNAFDRAANRPANRTGTTYTVSLLLGLRMLGDLKLLDEAIRLTELWYAHLTPDRTINNYLHHADQMYDQTLDVTLAAGVWARVMYAAYVNRDLISPRGYNYGAIATKYNSYLTGHFFPRWVIKKKSRVKSALDWRASLFRHSQPGIVAAQYYIGKMGGGGGYSATEWLGAAKQGFDRFFSADKVCDAGRGGRETLVFPFNTLETTTNDNGAALIYTTYVRYVISVMMDFFLEGADPRLNDLWWKRLSHSFADLTLYSDSKTTRTIGRTIAGDNPSSNERCGVPYQHEYRAPVSNVERRWQDSGYALLEGWDSTGTLIDFGQSMYHQAPNDFREKYPNYPAARIFTNIYHGWK